MKNILTLIVFLLGLSLSQAQVVQPGLHIDEEHTVLFGQDTTTHGIVKFMWQPSKGSLRAGLAQSAWDYSELGNVSAAFGHDTNAGGNFSFATGEGTAANSFAEFSIGQYSLVGGSKTIWSLNDPVFEIGNGTGAGAKSNMFTIQKNGNMKIGNMTSQTEVIEERLVVDGGIVLANAIDATPANGTIRYNGDFEGYAGGAWTSLTSGGGSSSVWNQSGTSVSYTAGDVGIGNSTPNSTLHVNGLGTTTSRPAMRVQVNGSTKMSINHNGGLTVGTFGDNLSPTNGLYVSGDGRFNSDVSIGATGTQATGYKLSVDGKIISEEVRVQDMADWPDYVFADEYDLRTIEELEKSILENKHLPGIPSAAEVEEEGILLGDMQRRMMEKIEELVLYTIQQEKRIKALEKLLLEK